MAFDEGTSAPVIRLFPNRIEPATGSRIPSISTGGANMKARIYATMASKRVGNISIPNNPQKILVFVDRLFETKLDIKLTEAVVVFDFMR